MTKDEINKLIVENEKLAYLVANRYRNSFKNIIEYEDIKSICLLGLVKAANTFNLDKGIAFSTYAYNVIRNELVYNIKVENKIINQISLDKPVDNNEELSLLLLLKDETNVEELTILSIQSDLLHKYIKELPADLQQIVYYYLEGLTQTEIADILNISQGKVSYLFEAALNKLRYRFEKGE